MSQEYDFVVNYQNKRCMNCKEFFYFLDDEVYNMCYSCTQIALKLVGNYQQKIRYLYQVNINLSTQIEILRSRELNNFFETLNIDSLLE